MTTITRIARRSPDSLFSHATRLAKNKNKSSYVTEIVLHLGFADTIFRGRETTAGNTSVFTGHIFFPSDNFSLNLFRLKGIICTPKLCNNKYRSPYFFKSKTPSYLSISTRENEGTEREAQGVGRGYVMSTKVIFRRTEVFVLAEVCLPRRPHAVLSRSQVLSEKRKWRRTWKANKYLCSFKHQTEVDLHADVSEDRIPLEQILPLV